MVSKIFDNADFGFHKITVERPLRLNFQASAERIARLEDETAFKNLADSNKKNEAVRLQEIEAGQEAPGRDPRPAAGLCQSHGETLYKDRKTFLLDLGEIDRKHGVRLICRGAQGRAQRPG